MKNNFNLKDLASALFSGYTFRTKVEHDEKGEVAVILMKDVSQTHAEMEYPVTFVDKTVVPEKFYLRKGDVLFLAKGANNFALVFDLNIPKAIATSAFFVIRSNTKKIIPTYLAWYINQSSVQQYLINNRTGTYTPSVSRSVLESIQIKLPNLKLQRLISNIYALSKKEQLLLTKIGEKRKALIESLLLNY